MLGWSGVCLGCDQVSNQYVRRLTASTFTTRRRFACPVVFDCGHLYFRPIVRDFACAAWQQSGIEPYVEGNRAVVPLWFKETVAIIFGGFRICAYAHASGGSWTVTAQFCPGAQHRSWLQSATNTGL